MLLLIWIILFCFALSTSNAQLDNIHYLPPIKSSVLANTKVLTNTEVVLSTPQSTAVTVSISIGTSSAIQTYSVVNGNPLTITLPVNAVTGNSIIATDAETGVVINNKGWKLTGSAPFLVTYKAKSSSNKQAEIFTTKGKAAIGTNFRWCGIPLQGAHSHKNAYMSVMATEDNTLVTISGLKASSTYRQGGAASGHNANAKVITLNKHECYILESIMNESSANLDGFLGASVVASKPIVMNNGHALGGYVEPGSNSRDLLMEQNVQLEYTGKTYIALKGNGSGLTLPYELVVIITTEDSTVITVNEKPYRSVAQAGEYIVINGNNYNNGVMFIETDKNTYCYQQVLGGTHTNTAGMIMLPALENCLPKSINEIPDVEKNNGLSLNGGVVVYTAKGANVTLNNISVGTLDTIPGNNEWGYYRSGPLSGDITISSTHQMAVGVITVNANAGCAGFYSGFGRSSSITASETVSYNKSTCPDTLYSQKLDFENYSWYRNDTLLASGALNEFQPINQTTGDYKLVTTWGGCVDTTLIEAVDCRRILPLAPAFWLSVVENIPVLEWELQPGNNNCVVEHSTDAIYWTELEENGTINKVKDILLFRHEEAPPGANYYRIRCEQADGAFAYTNIQHVVLEGTNKIRLFPNPFNFFVDIIDMPNNAWVRITNILGQPVFNQQVSKPQTKINLRDLLPGIYSLQVFDSTHHNSLHKTKIIKRGN